LRGLEDGGVGGNGLFNLTWEGEEVTVKLETDEDGSSPASLAVAFLGSMKCFIFAGGEREVFEVAVEGKRNRNGIWKLDYRQDGNGNIYICLK
jgi:hypothetical protein